MLAADDSELIRCTAAVAPVTRWELYGEWGFPHFFFLNHGKQIKK